MDIKEIEHRLSKIETDVTWVKKLNWIVLSAMVVNLLATIITS